MKNACVYIGSYTHTYHFTLKKVHFTKKESEAQRG